MPGIKRARDEDQFAGPAAKRWRVQPSLPRVKPGRKAFSTLSTGRSASVPDAVFPPEWYSEYRSEPVTGILPTDSLQDVPIESFEGDRKRKRIYGVEEYIELINQAGPRYKRIQVTFDRDAPSYKDLKALRLPDTYRERKPDLGPQTPGIDYTKAPRDTPTKEYNHPVYYAWTSNPLIAKAIAHIAEKNLPFVDFTSTLEHLPNVRPHDPYPFWRNDVDFLDTDTEYTPRPTDEPIRINFLPKYYEDGRHAIGFYTRKQPSERFCAVLFTPCTTEDLKRAHLWRKISQSRDEYEGLEVGATDGDWFHADVVEDYESWKHCIYMVKKEWKIRLRLVTREISEDDWQAKERDDGRWAWDRTE